MTLNGTEPTLRDLSSQLTTMQGAIDELREAVGLLVEHVVGAVNPLQASSNDFVMRARKRDKPLRG